MCTQKYVGVLLKIVLSADYVVVMPTLLDTRENSVSKAALKFTTRMIYGEKLNAAKHFIYFSNFYLIFPNLKNIQHIKNYGYFSPPSRSVANLRPTAALTDNAIIVVPYSRRYHSCCCHL